MAEDDVLTEDPDVDMFDLEDDLDMLPPKRSPNTSEVRIRCFTG